ncbi:DNA polymerase ligase N-terminal domain-containing protein [Actinoplanes teichomyceticus]|uniref:Bifunctional non-homologous end joining protein LigD n=1 Tax=Actinoplanes teichomyceticus TaxID=1867 RepID=A0A561WB90_ACTTI|nr:DNA polymerase ligase N-terminal domain-containing protein [Actinoplanes teichomyceticus]TWG21119.1 bifunctional non-homologous end joining protein LigD [Actinoplanes teichomyceticus]GIF14940.1 ATP-dependent DNA ligase [Actinoplanes teichomyceticus]
MAASQDRLDAYRRMRDFARTPEPSGAVTVGGARRFVVQRHRARRLHYDFRLEIGGVLVSWAVPKGPTLDPGVRRAAYHVEDHPLAYFDFEGVIPAGQYGGGDVIVWDAGTWQPRPARRGQDTDPARAVQAGELHLDLHGEKLRGRFALVRTGDGRAGRESWLLIHKRDEHAAPGWDAEQHPLSVLSGRTNEQVAAQPERMWRSDRPAERAAVTLRHPAASPGELAALDALGAGGTWEIFGRRLRVTNLDKVLFPGEPPLTKREFLHYTARVAPVVTPYLAGRALNMHRYPNGAGTRGFWHKELPEHAPDWLPRWTNPAADPGETRTYLVVDEPAALIWAANFGALEWHPWTSPVDAPHQPTYALVDIDPGTTTSWDDVLTLARLHRTAFEHLGVTARAKVTGRRGIQIWVPVAPGLGFDDTRAWVRDLSRSIGAVVPELVSWKWQKNERGGLARLDYTQNAINRTLVAPYSPRPAPDAPVSAPIDWAELDDPALRPDGFPLRSVLRRLDERGDLFRDVLDHPQKLPPLT